jgi:uncharacterized protein (DUF2147 family)
MRMMRYHMRFALAAAAMTALVSPLHAAEPSAAGLWQKSENGKPVVWVLVVDRGDHFEGAIARTFPKPGEPTGLTCSKCTDDRKDQPVLGLDFIRDMKREGAATYEGGNVLDPRDGKIYKAKMTVSPDGQSLTMRGYLGFSLLGKDETWQRLPDNAVALLDPTVTAKYMPQQPATTARASQSKMKTAQPARQ